MSKSADWIVDGIRVGEIRPGGSPWLDHAAYFEMVQGLPLPGDTIRHELRFAAVIGAKGGFVMRGPPISFARPASHNGFA
jgi:hypothetical protein